MNVRVLLTIPGSLVREPILWELNRGDTVVANVCGTSISDEMALVAVDMAGDAADVQEAIDTLRARGVRVTVSGDRE